MMLVTLAAAADRPLGQPFVTRSEAVAHNAMAATSQPLATLAALDIMRQGGNAVDAAIAANAMLALTEPNNCGLGGDLFAIVWDNKTKQLYGLNASGRSPQGLTLAEFERRGMKKIPQLGPLPVSVPGCVSGWGALHEKFGSLELSQLLGPAVHYAREGFPVTEVIARGWAGGVEDRKDFAGFADTYLRDGKAPQAGEMFRNPDLAKTLEIIAAEGTQSFYKGDIARQIAAFMEEAGGFLTYEDLAAHQADWVEPVSARYKGYDLWELPPNGQGIAALQMLQILKHVDMEAAGYGSADHVHYFLEAKKLAFEDRARFYADPTFVEVPVDWLISAAYGKQRFELIDPEKAATELTAGDPILQDGDTIYLTVADKDRNMVSLIQSNFRGFGSGLCPTGLGFGLQNRGELFNLEPGLPNSYAPGKRPFHTIIPAFVTKDGKPVMSFGVMGGDMQPQGHVQILLNLIDFEMGLQEAGDAPRINHSGSSTPTGTPLEEGGGEAHLEAGYSAETIAELERRGHKLTPASGVYGGYQAIWYDAENDVYHGATESRKDGIAAGY